MDSVLSKFTVKGGEYNEKSLIIQGIIFIQQIYQLPIASLGHVLCAGEMEVKTQGPYPHGTVLQVRPKKSKQMVDAKEETNGATGMTVERTLEMVV